MPKKTRLFSELVKNFSPERRARIDKKTAILRHEMRKNAHKHGGQ